VLTIRPSLPGDDALLRVLHTRAFGGPDEATLVDLLRDHQDVVASLVAEVDGRLAGHILFSRLTIDTPADRIRAAALAPLGVDPDFQRQGVGSALMREGLRACRDAGESIVIVVGHPAYYRRFGFSAPLASRLRSRYNGEAFMALELRPGALDGVEGDVRYPAAFDMFV